MHRVTGATLGAVAVGLVVVFLVAGFMVGAVPLAPLASPGHSAKAGTTTAVAPVTSPAATKVGPAAAPTARTYQTLIDLVVTPLPFVVATPSTLTFYTNITWGAINSADTQAWVNITNISTAKLFVSLSSAKNFPINQSAVTTFDNNGVLYSNYTWVVGLNASNFVCGTVASCGNVFTVGYPDYYQFAITVNENGASMSGGLASTATDVYTYMGATFTLAGLVTPVSAAFTPVPFVMSFWTNTTWADVKNSTASNITLQQTFFNLNTGAFVEYRTINFTKTLNSTNTSLNAGVSVTSTVVFSGYTAGIYYTNISYTVTLNQTALGCPTYSCNSTFLQGASDDFALEMNISGASVGGTPKFIFLYATFLVATYFDVGSTVITAGITSYPLSVQGLPFVQQGYLNTTWVNPAPATANNTITGWVQVWYYDPATSSYKVWTTWSLNNTVDYTNTAGANMVLVKYGYIPGLKIPYLNLTFNISYSATAANLGTTVPYQPYYVDYNVTFNGSKTGIGGVYQWLYGYVFSSTFAQYPTTASVALTTPAKLLPGYVPVYTTVHGANVGYTQNFSIAVTNAPINAVTTGVTVSVIDQTITKETGVLDYVSITPLTVADAQINYSFALNFLTMTCSTSVCAFLSSIGVSPGTTDVYAVNITVTVNGISTPTNGTFAAAYFQSSFYAVFAPPVFTLSAPNPGTVIAPGNVTVTVVYSGSFISTVSLHIYSSTEALVLSESYSTSGSNFTWVATSPGVYKASVQVVTAYVNPVTGSTSWFSNSTITISKTPRIYVNSTAYSNATLIPGVSAAGAGTLLLVLGLIIGMIVALLLGRAVWGGRQAPSPPQAWETKPAEGAAPAAAGGAGAGAVAAAGANTCSVCGKSFATPEELTAHGKSEHGME